MHEVFTLPEFFQLLSPHLDHASLANCCRVSKHWFNMFTPHLWACFGLLPSGHHDNSTDKTMWRRLFDGDLLSTDDVDSIDAVVAKYGHYIRTLIVRSHQALRIYQQHCYNLRVLHCEWERSSEVEQVHRDIEDFVKAQHQSLESLYLLKWMVSNEPQPQAATFSQYIETPRSAWLGSTNCFSMDDIPPYAQSIGLAVSPLVDLSTLPKLRPHRHLRYLRLATASIDPQGLTYILGLFPSLAYIYIQQEYVTFTLSLTPLALGLYGYDDDDGACIISQFPGLRSICFPGMGTEGFKALARHCPQLVEIDADPAAQTLLHEDVFEDDPPATISLLLESCPELKGINCPDQAIHIRHVMNGRPWVCKNLEFIRCQFVGVPAFYSWPMDAVDRMRNRWPEISEEERATLTDQEREIL
ncbi:hypothetical protein BGZ73_000508, partial [Actinomortierella ambigua]